ncbi:amidase [Rhodococcus oryzae]|uniref:amidase n=1 Tax=Rhodococcus oryzae TaxID=2571143 RepID=A0ABY2RGY2_9NOCA|nr:amidase [Rhodococcus oryzae]TJZ76414.1 amidase [Rhodococcus oryzae]
MSNPSVEALSTGTQLEFTAAAIAARVRSGALSPIDAVEDALRRISERDPELDSFVIVRGEQARAEAEALAERPDLSALPLAGVPIAIKDNIPILGHPLGNGSATTVAEASTENHPVLDRLRRAGAVPVAMTRLSELCVWPSTDSHDSIVKNPWNHELTAGGSSGGAGASVAAGMVPVAHGSDCLGSIRIPAAACGLVGIKPGSGLVPRELGENWFGMAENGPLTTTVEDSALLLSVMADRPELAELADPGRLRVAVAAGSPSPLTPVDRHWRGGAERTAQVLGGAGHTVTAARLPYPRNPIPLVSRWTAGTAAYAEGLDHTLLQARTRTHIAVGHAMRRLVRPRQVDRMEAAMRAFFADFDVVLTPTLARPPMEAHGWSDRSWPSNVMAAVRFAPFTPVWNLVGWPAVTVPVGMHPESGTPLGVQIAAPPGGEARILALAAQLQALQPWPRIAVM